MPDVDLCAICLKPVVGDDWFMMKLEDNAGKLLGEAKIHRNCWMRKVLLADELAEEENVAGRRKIELKSKGLSEEELKGWSELKEETKAARQKARVRAIVVFAIALLLGGMSVALLRGLFLGIWYAVFVGGFVYLMMGVVVLWGSMPGEKAIALMSMARSEDDPRMFAELQEARYYRMAGFGIVILGMILQVVGLVLGGR